MPLGAARFNTLSAAGGFDGNFELIETRSISAGIQTFDLSTDYIFHEFHFKNIWTSVNHSYLGAALSSDGGSTLVTGSYIYKFRRTRFNMSGLLGGSSTNANNWDTIVRSRQADAGSPIARNGISGYMRLMNFESSSKPTYMTTYFNQPTSSSGGYNNISLGAGSKTGTHNAIAFGDYQMSTGLLAYGDIYHYGLKAP